MISEQKIKLLQLMKHITSNISYYQTEFSTGLDFSKIDCDEKVVEVFNRLPIVDKRVLKSRLTDFIDVSFKSSDLLSILELDNDYKKENKYIVNGQEIILEHTSGTSGIPFTCFKTSSERLQLGASLWKIRKSFFPVGPKYMYNFVHNYTGRDYPFPFEKISDETERLIKEINFLANSQYYWWHTHTFRINKYAEIIKKFDLDIEVLKVIENNGSYISEDEKKEYEKVFNCLVADCYGCREIWNIAFSCGKNEHLHVNEDAVYFELVDDNGEKISQPNVEGDVVLTSLKLYTMPFVRYKIGDRAILIEDNCGSNATKIKLMPRRAKILGTDILGNTYFKGVVLHLPLTFNINKFDEISVSQVKYNQFIVNIKGNQEDKAVIESCFYKASKLIFSRNDFHYIFTYDNNHYSKSIFTCSSLTSF